MCKDMGSITGFKGKHRTIAQQIYDDAFMNDDKSLTFNGFKQKYVQTYCTKCETRENRFKIIIGTKLLNIKLDSSNKYNHLLDR